MEQLKVCSTCKESKPRSEFYKNKSKKDGLHPQCKVCSKENAKNWYKANPERGKENAKNWREANPERKKENAKNWYKANLERDKENKKAKQAKYKEINANRPESYYTDREGRSKICGKCKLDRPLIRFNLNKSNFDGLAAECLNCRNEYRKHKYNTDPEFRAKCILRDELRKLFKLSGLKKDKKSIELLGVSWIEAYNKLIDTLPEGYTEQDWLDRKLHVDHKIPISWYERLYGTLTEDIIKRVNHISNLQLLPVNDNLAKSNKYGHGINNEIILYEYWVITEQLSTISH